MSRDLCRLAGNRASKHSKLYKQFDFLFVTTKWVMHVNLYLHIWRFWKCVFPTSSPGKYCAPFIAPDPDFLLKLIHVALTLFDLACSHAQLLSHYCVLIQACYVDQQKHFFLISCRPSRIIKILSNVGTFT